MGTVPVTRGRLTGNQFLITISIPLNGAATDIDMNGTMTGNQMSGTMTIQGNSLEFTGRRPGASAEEVGQ